MPVTIRERVERFFFAPATPTNLGFIRAGVFSATAAFALQENVAKDAALARLNWRPASFYHLLGGPPSAGVLRAVQIALVVAAIFAAAGLFTKPSQLVATPLAAYLLGFDSNFGKVNHRSILLVLLLLAILPARLGDGVSLDRLRAAARTGSGAPVPPDPRYRWPVALAQVCAVSVYFFAGWAKIAKGGPEWFAADSFRRFIYARIDQLPSPPDAGLWLGAHPGLAQAAAIASVAFELSVVLVLIWPRLKALILPGLVVFHEATRALVRIDFRRTLVAALIPLVDYQAIGTRVRRRFRRPRSVVLLDGECDLCRRTGAVFSAMDSLERLEFADARRDTRLAGWEIDRERALDEMYLVSPSGRIDSGYDAYRRLATMLPGAWPLVPLLNAPGVRSLGRRLYRRIARSRLPVLHCTSSSCTIGREQDAISSGLRPGGSERR